MSQLSDLLKRDFEAKSPPSPACAALQAPALDTGNSSEPIFVAAMIALAKPVRRKTRENFLHYRRPIVVKLLPGDCISLHLLRHKRVVTLSLHDLYFEGVRRQAAVEKAARKKNKRRKIKRSVTAKIKLDLSGPEFSSEGKPRAWSHTHHDFVQQLKRIGCLEAWAEMWDGLLDNYRAVPTRPHFVHEAFMRKDRGYITLILAGTSLHGELWIHGLLYECRLNLTASREARRNALLHAGRDALTQLMAQATGDPDYMIRWDRP